MANYVFPLGRVVTSDTLTAGDCNVGDILQNPVSGAADLIGQDPSGAPSVVPLLTDATGAGASYTPANLVNWSGVAPSSLADALDRIAASVGPIP